MIAVLPKNYRRIVLAAIERAADPVLFMNGERVTDFSQAGPITDAILVWQFTPTLVDKVPVPSCQTIAVNVNLEAIKSGR